MADQQTSREINRLYWGSDASVSEIADRLGVSRRALYDGIEPRPAGADCPECGAPLGYRNRTAAENREAECPSCGFDTALPTSSGVPDRDRTRVERERGAAPVAHYPSPYPPPRGHAGVLGATLVLGLAIGAVIAFLLRRR